MHYAAAIAIALGSPAPAAEAAPVQGMTISCQTWGWEWGSDDMVESMRELRDLGVNWIAIHPYAGIREDGTVRWRHGDEPKQWLTRPIAEAHKLGMKIMIKPHLAYWGSPFSWRGDIAFETDEQWARFFSGYQKWINALAEICCDADAFVVGTELDRTIQHEAAWRRIIAGVRERFNGPLTYAANWTDYERVPFWDDLDAIGVQAYFPLAEEAGPPTRETLDAAWQRWMRRLSKFSIEQDRPIVFTELGYCRSPNAAVRPWEGREGGEHADETQRMCMQSALAALNDHDRIVGAFLWKWFPGEHRRANFLMSRPAMRTVIDEHWGE